ncbi:GGDEF domain-containing protein [Oceanospirillum sp.]|uniref:GGDEF domain-containing protein n=1 Tax=Oceanospirillum sp. TaxID=2021254 RepID=UPI003A906EFE
MPHTSVLTEIIESQTINTLFQPIIGARGESIFAYEALSRGPSDSYLCSPVRLFEEAKQQHQLFALESICRRRAIENFTRQQLPGKLFLNVTPETLLQPDHHKGLTLDLLNNYGLQPDQVVIEITEHSPTHDYELMCCAVRHYQGEGFSIALDDLGAGYSSLRLWSELQPEYVKIDRHFVSGIESDKVKRDFVRSILEIARAVNSQVVAEGIETRQEFETLTDIGVDFFQGYYFARPHPQPIRSVSRPARMVLKQNKESREMCKDDGHIGRLKLDIPPVTPETLVEDVVDIFEQNEHWFSVPVVSAGVPVGIVMRSRLLQKLSKAFGRDLYSKKPVSQILDKEFMSVEHHMRLETVSQQVTQRNRHQLEEDFIITRNSYYYGVGQVIDLLKEITEMQLKSAQSSNPLTGLPGNVLIQERIDQLIENQASFVVCYFDLDNFKAYNDQYGYAKGDEILLSVSLLLKKHCHLQRDFVGHVGGDDYVVVFKSSDWQSYVQAILNEFSQHRLNFYSAEHLRDGGIWTEDRFGEKRFFDLMSISVAAIDSDSADFSSAKEVAGQLSHIKHEAKHAKGNSLVAQLAGSVVNLFSESEEYASGAR